MAVQDDPERYLRLEHLCGRTYFDVRELYGSTQRDKRRAQLAHALSAEVATVPSSRLMALIGQALKWCVHCHQHARPRCPAAYLASRVAGLAPCVLTGQLVLCWLGVSWGLSRSHLRLLRTVRYGLRVCRVSLPPSACLP